MINLKTKEEVDLIRKSSKILINTHCELAKLIQPGISSAYLDKIAEEFIRDNAAIPSFKGYNNFPNTLCVSPDEQVVHGLPNKNYIEEGTLLSIDCGVFKYGYHSDCAFTYEVGEVSLEKKKLIEVTRKCLDHGVSKAIIGNHIGDIGNAIQTYAEFNNYGVVRELVGHGIGKNLHESPEVPNYGKSGSGSIISKGMVLAIEPMINMGTKNIYNHEDGWTITTQDMQPSAHFEYTVSITDNGVEILTPFDSIDNIIFDKK